ncbi:MAG: RluA family pseudouridine synthase [Desulfovibrionaceae bacterium]
MPSPEPEHTLVVSAAESGQKLLQYLVRRLGLSQSMLHRWIRTGQIRVNGGRGKPFLRIADGDQVRLPPFALKMAASTQAGAPAAPAEGPRLPAFLRRGRFGKRASLPADLSLPPLIARQGDIWAYDKPAGLPVQPGTGHADSMATRLAAAFSGAPFLPTPAHRLDMDTSGVLLVGASYGALRLLQDAFRSHGMVKEYLAWVEGRWEHEAPRLLCHQMAKKYSGYFERVETGAGRDACCIVSPLLRGERGSLLHVRLITGRTHQIRVQLSACGHPLMGDGKYGAASNQGFLLHACRLILPNALPDGGTATFETPPPWTGGRALGELPPSLTDASCQDMIAEFLTSRTQ